MSALLELAARCESAAGPDRELDALIAPLQGLRVVDEGHPIGRMCYDDIGAVRLMPRYTASLDAAMTLVPEDCEAGLGTKDSLGKAWAWVGPDVGENIAGMGSAINPALALTAAALRARATGEQP